VQPLEDGDQVVAAALALVGGRGVGDREPHPPAHAGLLGVAAGGGDHVPVEVEAVDGDPRVGQGHGDARPAGAARQVGDARGRVGAQPPVDGGDGRQPLEPELVEEHRAVVLGPALRLPRQRRRRAAVAERLHQVRQRAPAADDLDALVRLVADVVGVGEHRHVRRRQPVAAGERVRPGVVDLQQPAGGVVLQPLPDVALDGAGPLGQLGRGRRAALGQRPVQPQPLAEVDGVQLQRPDRVLEQPLRQGRGGVAGTVRRCHGRGSYPLVAPASCLRYSR
jgi:hypothetical protein